MLKKTMTTVDFDGNERTEDYYFHLTKAELMEWNFSTDGGLEKHINKIIAEQDLKRIIELFKELILKSYGVKSMDGKRFIKSPEQTAEFMQTQAYSDLYMELATNAEAGAAFVKGIVPADLAREAEKNAKFSQAAKPVPIN